MGLSAFFEKVFAGRWIAGSKIGDAVNTSKRFNSRGIKTIINYLGEAIEDKAQIADAVITYDKLIQEIKKAGLNSEISVKASQLGLRISRKTAARNYSNIVKSARRAGVFVWLDMEEHQYVDDTIWLYRTQLQRKGVGICIQSYLRRSESDIRKLAKANAVIRLVKGAYKESNRVAFSSRKQTTENYSRLMKYLFKHSERFMIGTHDLELLGQAVELNRSFRRDVTYAMLNGIRNKEAARLAMTNKVAVYVPFGGRWLEYSFRRLKEEGHLTLIIRSLMQSQRI